MAHSLEIRVPFLDHRLIEFMAKVPPIWKIMGINEKYLLKKFFRGILPETIVGRTKHPYRAPIQQSLCVAFRRRTAFGIISPRTPSNKAAYLIHQKFNIF